MDGLKNMVVVVDEDTSETVYAEMEDQLSALGERWTHICQWKEERTQNIDYLNRLWINVTEDYKKLVAWLSDTEITLKQMEAHPASEIGEVLERIKRLQVLKIEMEMGLKKLAFMDKAIQELDEKGKSQECNEILEKLENLQDRWEAIGQILEVQSQRVS